LVDNCPLLYIRVRRSCFTQSNLTLITILHAPLLLSFFSSGVENVKKSNRINPRYVFIAPPSLGLLEERLRDRGTESEEAIQKRTANAKGECDYGNTPGNFDKVVINEVLEDAIEELTGLLNEWYPHLANAATVGAAGESSEGGGEEQKKGGNQ
jgi:guanylate kinase